MPFGSIVFSSSTGEVAEVERSYIATGFATVEARRISGVVGCRDRLVIGEGVEGIV
jgi:hypothetical protein